ncbi:aldehyde/histidinol dehydrogenase [Artemisia annua]|uniref:Succinate-semialdehyde dehydrogenase, mitochondrial n=1 Tax=Artemisia annua TaxID=35608 RepID=A0A2U1NF62_ARTAN|nr:aldehyde/histidinol dehydrogenase [Artemisia annua]
MGYEIAGKAVYSSVGCTYFVIHGVVGILYSRKELATKFRNTGQTCVCADKILVQEGTYEKFMSAFSKAVQDLKVGNGFSEDVVQLQISFLSSVEGRINQTKELLEELEPCQFRLSELERLHIKLRLKKNILG